MLQPFADAARNPKSFVLSALKILFELKGITDLANDPGALTAENVKTSRQVWEKSCYPGTDASPPEGVLFPRLIALMDAVETKNQFEIERIIHDLNDLWQEEVGDLRNLHVILATACRAKAA